MYAYVLGLEITTDESGVKISVIEHSDELGAL